jgi:hypothetical protein
MFNSNKKWVLILVTIFTAITFLTVGSFDSRLANSNGDDHPMVWARYFSKPQIWQGDGNEITAKYFGVASLPNLLATVTGVFDSRIPYLLSWSYVFIQILGLGLAIYFFSQAWTKSAGMAAVVTLLTFAMTPWQNNLAYYPNMIHSPYPGHLVMPLIVLACYLMLRQQKGAMVLALSIAGLIHPSQTIHFVFLAFLFELIHDKRLKRDSLLWYSASLITSFLVPLFLIPKTVNGLSDGDLLPSALLNPHLVPWENTTFWPFGIPSLIGAFFLSSLYCRPFSKEESKKKCFWWANLVALIVFGFMHWTGAKLKILPILLLCPFRVSVINSVLLAPLGFIYLWENLRSRELGLAMTSASLIGLLVISTSGLFWGPLLILAYGEVTKTNSQRQKISLGLILFWWFLLLLVGKPVRDLWGVEVSGGLRSFLVPGSHFTLAQILVVFVSSGIFALLSQIENRGAKNYSWITQLFVAFVALFQSYQIGAESKRGVLRDRWELEKWAAQHSSQQSLFLMNYGSWRGIAERKAQVVGYRENGILPYFRYPQAKQFELKLGRLYQSFHQKDFDALSDSQLLILSREFKGTHVIESTEHNKRDFPVVYENSSWRVYQIMGDT